MKNRVANDIIIFLLVFLFFYTATSKLFKHSLVVANLKAAPLVGNYSFLLSWGIPSIEIVAGVLLILPKTRNAGYIMAGCLLVIFTMYLVIMLWEKQDLPCPCGGIFSGLSWPAHVILNLFFIGACITGYRLHQLFYCNKTGNAENLQKE